jgi:autotransporter-associated beta strand protein
MKRCWIAGWVLCLSLATSYSADNLWTGATSTDWNDPANWAAGGVPDTTFGDNAVVSTTIPNIATITADILYTPNDINVTGGGRIDHRAGVAGTSGGAWMKVENGTYNLADTGTPGPGLSGFAQGTGSLSATGNLLVGAWGDNRNGTINVNTTGTFAVSGELFFGDSTGSQGALNLESGTMTVNNKIFVGNNRGTGTMTMSGGSLTKTGGDQTFVGRDNGTGTLTQSGGTVSLNHDFYVGQGGGGNGTVNLSGSAVLNTGRDFVIGREGGTGSLNVTGGTITKTGDEKMIVGHNNGKGFVVHSGGTISANNELYIGNEKAASGVYTLSGTGALVVSNEIVVGRETGAGTINVNGGTIATQRQYIVSETTNGPATNTVNGHLYIGRRSGFGALEQNGGEISVDGDFALGTRDQNQDGIGTCNLSGGSLAVTNNMFVGKEGASRGTMTMTGGIIMGHDKLIIGDNGATGVLNQSAGTMNVQNEIYIGNGLPPAQGTRILSNANDGQLEKRSDWAPGTVTVQDTVNWNVNVGEWYGSGLNTVVLPFQLPNFGAVANPFASATFGVNLYNKGNATLTDLDLYAVRVSASPQIATTDWYNGSAPDPNATLIQASFLTPASTTTSVGPQSGPNNLTDTAGSAALLAYLNSAYNGGAGAGKFVFLRVSYGSDTFAAGWDAYNFTTRNTALEGDAPVINFTSTVPPLPPAGTYTVSGAAEVNVGNEVIVGRENGTGTLNLDGGTVNATKISGGTGTATVNFNGGVLKAKRDESNLIENLDVANVQSGGLKIDSNGFNVSTSQALTGAGGLEKLGAGQLTLSGANTYSGTTTVAAGVLRVEKTGLNAIVNATENTLVAEFAAPTAPGAYRILPGPLAGSQTFSATGLGLNQEATFDWSTSTVTVTGELVTGSTFASLYPANSEATLGSNGLSNLMNYALGGVGESSIPALPQLTVGVNGLTLTGNVRTDDTGLTIRGETATSLSGPWTPVDLSATGAPSAVLNTTVKSFTVPIDPAEPKKFLRFQVTK